VVEATLTLAQAESAPAGGAEIVQVVIATGGALILTAALLIVGLGHRSGRIGLLRWADELSRRVGGDLPGWAGVPAALAVVTLLPALFGLAWDEALHIDNGRDPGPLANPSHYLLLGGLFGIFTAGWLACVMPGPGEKPSPAAVRIGPDWYAPVGGLLVLFASAFALLGFPLDDISHRLFGQDVTLWGATHLMMMSGAVAAVLGIIVLLTEGRLARRASRGAPLDAVRPDEISLPALGREYRLPSSLVRALRPLASGRFQMTIAAGGMLAALSIFQGEFDYGVPQFRLLFHPVLIAFAAALALTMGRIVAGRGAALGAVAFFVLVRGLSTLIIGGAFSESVAHFPIYLAEALMVEGIALIVAVAERPYRFGGLVGIACGTGGVIAEYLWSQIWMPLPWPAHLLGEAMLFGTIVGVVGGVLGAFLGSGMLLRGELMGRRAIAASALSVATLAAVLIYLGHTTPPSGSAEVTLADAPGAEPREAAATVRFDPADAADNPDWLYVIAWQGGEPLRNEELTETAPGTYTTPPVPVGGSWKSAIRLQRGDEMGSIPLFAPADAEIPAPEIPAPLTFERAFVNDREFLQRERREGVADWSIIAFGIGVACFVLALFVGAGYCLVRIAQATPSREQRLPLADLPDATASPRPSILMR
jgi:hypothetical protein